MENFRNLKQRLAEYEAAEPVVVSLEYDTCRIFFPGSEQYVTFELHNITDAFLASGRTEKDMDKYGVELVMVPSNTRIAEAGAVQQNTPQMSNISDARVAEQLGVSEDILLDARALALDALLSQLQSRKQETA